MKTFPLNCICHRPFCNLGRPTEKSTNRPFLIGIVEDIEPTAGMQNLLHKDRMLTMILFKLDIF